ncbi:MAG: hypothetical protein CMB99_13625 [Flavobacteriaceae bacterium]|nr:hypothetical protein [Flavobacteriaceae bacterium]|tara:strand:+ start:11540 stop:12106 length:567 start_codon:yes stop_codon:yes gene_type:complete
MNTKYTHLITIILFLVFAASCSNAKKFKIAKGQVGEISKKTMVQDLGKIFAKDSLVKNLSEGSMGDDYFQDDDEYMVYDTEGKLLLTIMPKDQHDSTSTIKSIEIHDSRFTTESGLNLDSRFVDINANNRINRVESTLKSATLFIDELNATIVIDKEELGLQEYSTQKVSLDQIPDLARIKSFIIWFQ